MTTATKRRTGTRSVTTAERVAVSYDRISKFKVNRGGINAELTIGVDRQHETNTSTAEALDLGPISEDRRYSDNNRSASQFRTKERDRWNDLLAFIRTGAASHVLVWLFDRAYRTTEDCENLLAACREGGALIVQTAGNPTVADPNNPDDIFRLKLAGLLAEYEVAKMSVRQRAAKNKAAEQGIPHGGRRRFGYEQGMSVLREGQVEGTTNEVQVIRDLASRLLAGESLHSCAKTLNADKVPTPGGGIRWTGSNLRTMMLRPHLAGLRVHHGEVSGDASWPAILSVEVHESLKALLTDEDRRTSFTTARKYLLSGVATCATCGLPMRGRTRHGRKDPTPVYICSSSRHVHRTAADVDEAVETMILARLEQTDASGAVVDSTAADLVTSLTERLAELRRQHETKADDLLEADASDKTVATVLGALERKIAKVDADLKSARASLKRPEAALEGMTGSDAARAWSKASLGRKQAILRFLCVSITVRGSKRNGKGLTADDIDITWRDLSDPID